MKKVIPVRKLRKLKEYSFTSSNSPYGANVVFKDEPKTIYAYFIFNDGHIDQTGYSGNTQKHYEN